MSTPDRYPNRPGWRQGPNSETSREAADKAAKTAQPLKVRVVELLRSGPASPEELVQRFADQGDAVLLNTIRARCTDLGKVGVLRPSGSYGRGESGKTRVIRWEVVPEQGPCASGDKA